MENFYKIHSYKQIFLNIVNYNFFNFSSGIAIFLLVIQSAQARLRARLARQRFMQTEQSLSFKAGLRKLISGRTRFASRATRVYRSIPTIKYVPQSRGVFVRKADRSVVRLYPLWRSSSLDVYAVPRRLYVYVCATRHYWRSRCYKTGEIRARRIIISVGTRRYKKAFPRRSFTSVRLLDVKSIIPSTTLRDFLE